MSQSSRNWLKQQQRDPFVRLARNHEYRSRAVYKLMEIDRKDGLFRPGQSIVDLGAAPGSWSQYARALVGNTGRIIALDILPMEPLPPVTVLQGDFTDAGIYRMCLESLAGQMVDLVISDLAPNLTGIRSTDQARSMALAELVYEFSGRVLRPGGGMLIKLFQGEGTDAFRKEISQRFERVVVRKPAASRDHSREFYILARGYDV